MNPDALFMKGVDTYNLWYKFVDDDNYNIEAIRSFQSALKVYRETHQHSRAYDCYSWIIKCSINSNQPKLQLILADVCEAFGCFVIKQKMRDNPMEYFVKADTTYNKFKMVESIIRIKEKQRKFLKKNIKNQLKLLSVYQSSGNQCLDKCNETFKNFDIKISQSTNESIIANQTLVFSTNVKMQDTISQNLRNNTISYVRLGNELTRFRLKKEYNDFINDNRQIDEHIRLDTKLVQLVD
jgi:hypothetical protein